METQDKFIEEAYEEISADEQGKILSNARVVQALRSKEATHGEVMVGEACIKFRLSINKKLRRKLVLYKSKMADTMPTPEELERVLYDLLSSICVEDPWNTWQTWAVYDEAAEDNGAQEILVQILKQINKHMEDVKNFR